MIIFEYIAENSDLIEDSQRPSSRFKINFIITEDMIERLTSYGHLGTVHKHLLGKTRCKKVGLNICDPHKGTLKKNRHKFLSENWIYMILWGPVDP